MDKLIGGILIVGGFIAMCQGFASGPDAATCQAINTTVSSANCTSSIAVIPLVCGIVLVAVGAALIFIGGRGLWRHRTHR